MGDFFSFRLMVTPVVIRIVFLIGLLFIVVSALVILVGGDYAWQRLLGILYLLFGPMLWRVCCEIFLLLFHISSFDSFNRYRI